ncbi:hypothetical protein STEG23_002734 [Scotinomys teguina]
MSTQNIPPYVTVSLAQEDNLTVILLFFNLLYLSPLYISSCSTIAVCKNKRLTKGSKKGAKKKVVDPFSKKDWYDVKALAMFNIRNIEKTLVMRTQGTKIASDVLKGRVFEVSLADLQND